MADERNTAASGTEETDWERKLKEYMAQPAEESKEATVPSGDGTSNGEEDDLTSLLRAQLAAGTQSHKADSSVGEAGESNEPLKAESESDTIADSSNEAGQAEEAVSEQEAEIKSDATGLSEPDDAHSKPLEAVKVVTAEAENLKMTVNAADAGRAVSADIAEDVTTDKPTEAGETAGLAGKDSHVPAPDDEINGIPLEDYLTSTAFLGGLDKETQEKIRTVMGQPAPDTVVPDHAEPSDAPKAPSVAPIPGEQSHQPPREADTVSQSEPATQPDIQHDRPAGSTTSLHKGQPNTSPVGMSDSAPSPRQTGTARRSATAPSRIQHDPLQLSLDSIQLPTHGSQSSRAGTTPRIPGARQGDAPASGSSPDRSSSPVQRRERSAGAVAGSADQSPESKEQTDTELYMRLGYEKDIRKTAIGRARADAARRTAASQKSVGTRNTIPAAYRGREYTGRTMTPEVEATYRHTVRGCLMRLILAAMGVIAGLCWDCLPFIQRQASAGVSFSTSPLYPLFGILLLVLVSLPFLRRLGLGLRSLWDFEPVRYAVPAMAVLVSLIHSLVALLTACFAENGGSLVLFLGGTLTILAAGALSELLAARAEWRSFRVISSGKARYVMTRLEGTDPSLSGEASDRRAPRRASTPPPLSLRIRRTRGIPDFFARANGYNNRLGHLNYLLPVALLCAIVSGGLAVLFGGHLLPDGIQAFTATYLSCLPAAYLFSTALPLFLGNRILCESGCAVVGESAPDEYVPWDLTRSGMTQLFMADGCALHAYMPNDVTVKGDPRETTWRIMAHKLFALADCPLANTDIPIRREELTAIRVEVAEVGENFMKLYMIDTLGKESVEVMLGSYEALSERGITLPPKEAEASYRKTPGARVVYLAFDRVFRIAVAAEYRVSRQFIRAVRRLDALHCRVTLVSYDPLVTPATLSPSSVCDMTTTAAGMPPVRLIHPKRYSELYTGRSGGLVATAEGLDLCRPLIACRRMKISYRRGTCLSWCALPVASTLFILLSFFGVAGYLLPGLVLCLQLLSVSLSTLMSVLTVSRHSLSLDESAHIKSSTDKHADKPASKN